MRHIITIVRAKRYDAKQNDEAVRRVTNSYAASCCSITWNCRILLMSVRIRHFVQGSWYSSDIQQRAGRFKGAQTDGWQLGQAIGWMDGHIDILTNVWVDQ
jgi:hypothetical protein